MSATAPSFPLVSLLYSEWEVLDDVKGLRRPPPHGLRAMRSARPGAPVPALAPPGAGLRPLPHGDHLGRGPEREGAVKAYAT